MFSADHIKSLQKKTESLLQHHEAISIHQLEDLRDVLRFHEFRYYVQNDPLISDYEFDLLFKALEKLERENPTFITHDSPTQRVAGGLIKDFPKVNHLVPMLSLENSYNADDMLDWDRKARELSGLDEIEYCVEPKFDGASISLIYENDLLIRGATRGDGTVGDDITTNIRQIKSVPLSAAFSRYGIKQAEIRGEVLMNKKNFRQYNEKLMEEGIPPLANPRNAAAGSLRIKDPKEVSRRNLEAFIYNVSHITDSESGNSLAPETHAGFLEMLWNIGFRSPQQEKKICKGIHAVLQHIEAFEAKRDDLDYEIDGMVIKVNSLDLQEQLGMTSHHPRWAIAYKFKARQGTSKLLGISFFVGRTGAITPTAQIEPVHVGGVTITNITLHNENYIKEKDLRIGDTVLVERSGDVIPQIVKSLPELRTGNEKIPVFPENCPVCNDKLFKPEDEAVWRCININCKAQVLERIIHFVSKDAMDIRSFGEANVKKFFEEGLLNDIPGVYELDFEKISAMEGFGKKSVENLQQAIQQSKTQPLHRLIYALGIRYVGETTAKTIAHNIEDLLELENYSVEQLQEMEDVGVKVAASMAEFFSNKDNIQMIKRLKQLGVQTQQEKQTAKGGNLSGQTFLFTGTLNKLKRTEAEEMVENQGGKILSGVSSKLNFLIVGEEAGSKLEKAKKLNTIRILTEDEFLEMLAG